MQGVEPVGGGLSPAHNTRVGTSCEAQAQKENDRTEHPDGDNEGRKLREPSDGRVDAGEDNKRKGHEDQARPSGDRRNRGGEGTKSECEHC